MELQSGLTILTGGEVYTPDRRGVRSILIGADQVLAIGEMDASQASAAGIPCKEIDVSGCIITPGLIDPHQHLIGAGGEQGFASRQPPVPLDDLLLAGITTAVGCLGTDVSTRRLPALLGKVQELRAQGISAYMHTGGFPIPSPTISGSIVDDLVYFDPIIGLGQIAISDYRSTEPTTQELARVVSQAIMGGMIGGKAGVTHFHTGSGPGRLRPLNDLLDETDIPARYIYPTHTNRNEEILAEGVALVGRGSFIDLDTTDGHFEHWLSTYLALGGPTDRITVTSDAHTPGARPGDVWDAFVRCAQAEILPLEALLCVFSANAASVLSLPRKGRIDPGHDADLLVIERDSFTLRHVFARGAHMVCDGQVLAAA
jgi:beta-aspartyl-dipeptidase (metallo-type)